MHEAPRSKLAAALRVWVDVVLAAVALAAALLAVYLVVTSFTLSRPGARADGAVWVGIGSSSLVPIHGLELAPGPGPAPLSDPVLVKAHGELRFHTRRLDLMALSFLPILLVAGAVLAGGWQLRQVLAAVARGEPFAALNARRVAAIGWIIVAVAALEPLLGYVPAAAVLRAVELEDVTLSPTLSFDPGTLLTGLLVLALATVLREGARLHEEQSLTV